MKCFARIILMLLCFAVLQGHSRAQDSSGLSHEIVNLPDKLLQKIDSKTSGINRRLIDQTDKYLSKLAKQEEKLRKQLAQKDSTAAARIFGDVQKQYTLLRFQVKEQTNSTFKIMDAYLPHLDSLQTALHFLEKTDSRLRNIPDVQQRMKAAVEKMDVLQSKLTQAEQVRKFVQERQQLLQQQLAKYNLSGKLKSYHKQVYYYKEQVEEYRQVFSHPSRLEARMIELLGSTAKFRDFFANNSQLGRLFRLPGGGAGDSHQIDLTGLQTREVAQQQLQQRFGSSGYVQQVMNQSLQNGPVPWGGLKEQIAEKVMPKNLKNEGSVPDFKPNGQKVKSFMRRLELGSNLQTVKANRFFPSTTDVGLSLGYKLNDRSVVGVGGAYKMGWGKDIRHVRVTHQGLGVRTYFDFKLKGSLWISGGAELNHRSEFKSFDVLKEYSSWQRSALVGLSKKYQISSKVKGNMQLLYDMLWKQQVPRTQALLFRIGYSLQ